MKNLLLTAAIVVTLSGCASIMNGPTQSVTIKSTPEGAAISVTNKAGEKVHTGTAPLTVALKRSAGYFKPEVYTVAFVKEGFAPKEVVITGTMSGWFIGNLLFGGLIGMLAVDPVTGSMYTLPSSVGETLAETPAKTSENSLGVSALSIVSTTTLTPEQLKLARLVVQ
jgi:uncharacterized protein YceK